MDYLNDIEEYVGFFDRRLPIVVRESAEVAVADANKTPAGAARIGAMGGPEPAIETITKGITDTLRAKSDLLGIPYVACFCTPTSTRPDDGLLSQWRGYGSDGGYAIVLRTAELDALMREEVDEYWYLFAHAGDVEYYDDMLGRVEPYEETIAGEADIRDALQRFLLSGSSSDLGPLFSPLEKLACLHKHCGFSEENEVRFIGAIGSKDQDFLRETGNGRPHKPVRFRIRGGVPVPYISSFERAKRKLPIERVIVGPHSEREHRRKAVSLLLQELGISADVVVSDIPFVGR